MSRFRLFLLGLLAVLAVGVVASASASAESCTGGTSLVFCTSPGNAPLVGETVLGLSGLSLLAGNIGAEAKFHCLDDHFTATLEKLGLFTGLILFLNCKEELPANCKLTAADEKEIHTQFIAQQLSTTLALFTGSGPAETFATLHVAVGGGCAVPGTYTVTGKQKVETPTGGTGKVEQEVVAKKSGSGGLKLGAAGASFSSSAKAMLGGANIGTAWLVMTAGV